MKSYIAAVICLLSTPVFGGSTSPPPESGALSAVIKEVTTVLEEYQKNRGSGDQFELPPLKKAEFDFKVTAKKKGGFSIDLLIFHFGASTEKELVNDVTFTYAFRSPQKGLATRKPSPPPPLAGELAATIQKAAQAVKNAATAAGLPFSKLTVLIQYGVTWNVDAGGKVTYSFVTISGGAEASKNTIQSVKLEFEK
ncbi:MAG: hypothetical protein ACM3JH_07245 [Acidithiobacillales bacterium]